MRSSLACSSVLVLFLSHCSGSAHPPAGVAAREPGCPVEVVNEGVPARPTRLLGEVVARCVNGAEVDQPRCMRQLQDEACRMGGQVIWALRRNTLENGLELRASTAVYR